MEKEDITLSKFCYYGFVRAFWLSYVSWILTAYTPSFQKEN